MDKTVVVTGMGVVSPLESGKGLEVFWAKMLKGESMIKQVTSFNVEGYASRVAAEVDGFDTQERHPDRWIQIAGFAFDTALKDASLTIGNRIGLSLGTVLGGIVAGERHWGKVLDNTMPEPPSDYALSSGVNYLAENYGINGPVITVSTACASGTDAIGIAYRKILLGKADIMIAGGVDVLSKFAFSGFNTLQAMTRDKVRPFDKRRDGLALGEGAAFLVLENEDSALRRKVNIHGRILGYASRGDAHHLTGPDREGKGLSEAIRVSMREAGLGPSQVDYINAHGTGTVYNDAMETKAIKSVFGRDAYNIPINSIKAMIGHTFGAAGAIEAVVCLLAIRDGAIPPTINYKEMDPECDLDYVPNEVRRHRTKTAISLSAGFGGQDAAIVFGDA
ncbi:MAG: beta-ketoacyl-[acyl-carrier-protein] synthase family protein [Thermodesulfobacteriota bacterium]